MSHWFIVRDGTETGPINPAQLKHMAATGRLLPDDKVRRDDVQAPVPARKVKGLFPDEVPPLPAPQPPQVVPVDPPPLPAAEALTALRRGRHRRPCRS